MAVSRKSFITCIDMAQGNLRRNVQYRGDKKKKLQR